MTPPLPSFTTLAPFSPCLLHFLKYNIKGQTQSQIACKWFLGQLLTNAMTLVGSLTLPYVSVVSSINLALLIGWWWGMNELARAKCLEQSLETSRCFLSLCYYYSHNTAATKKYSHFLQIMPHAFFFLVFAHLHPSPGTPSLPFFPLACVYSSLIAQLKCPLLQEALSDFSFQPGCDTHSGIPQWILGSPLPVLPGLWWVCFHHWTMSPMKAGLGISWPPLGPQQCPAQGGHTASTQGVFVEKIDKSPKLGYVCMCVV